MAQRQCLPRDATDLALINPGDLRTALRPAVRAEGERRRLPRVNLTDEPPPLSGTQAAERRTSNLAEHKGVPARGAPARRVYRSPWWQPVGDRWCASAGCGQSGRAGREASAASTAPGHRHRATGWLSRLKLQALLPRPVNTVILRAHPAAVVGGMSSSAPEHQVDVWRARSPSPGRLAARARATPRRRPRHSTEGGRRRGGRRALG